MYMKTLIPTPIGDLIACAEDDALIFLDFADTYEQTKNTFYRDILGWECMDNARSSVLAQTAQELHEYFQGKRQTFDIPIRTYGTAFQQSAWQALTKIPYGETRSYREEAALAGHPRAVRAIGSANNKNPIVIIIACHRIIGANGSLVGYGWGIERKKWLLEHEARQQK